MGSLNHFRHEIFNFEVLIVVLDCDRVVEHCSHYISDLWFSFGQVRFWFTGDFLPLLLSGIHRHSILVLELVVVQEVELGSLFFLLWIDVLLCFEVNRAHSLQADSRGPNIYHWVALREGEITFWECFYLSDLLLLLLWQWVDLCRWWPRIDGVS